MTTKTAAERAAKKPARKRKLDLDRLRKLADELAEYGGEDLTNLIHRWETEEGMKIRSTSAGRVYAKVAGLEAGARGSAQDAVRNWGQAARRAVLKGAG